MLHAYLRRTLSRTRCLPPGPPTLTFLSLSGTRVPMGPYGLCPPFTYLRLSSAAKHFPLHCFSTTLPFNSTAHGSHEDGDCILQKHSDSTQSPFVTLLSRRAQSGRWSSFGKRVWFTESHTVLVISFLLFVLFSQFIVDEMERKSCCIKLNN